MRKIGGGGMHILGKYDGERSQWTSVAIVSADTQKNDKIKNFKWRKSMDSENFAW